jgi:hypothetical protein
MATQPAPQAFIRALRLHPRIAYQGLYAGEDERARLLATIPRLIPFRRTFHAAIAIVDWDHHLPTRTFALRVYAYYDEASFSAGEAAYDDRLEEIGTRDRYPEFDVPDFGDLPADEAYEAELDPQGAVQSCRLTSSWRREIAPDRAEAAVAIARASEEFIRMSAMERPRNLGDLEAVSWTPPCESGHQRWTLDVWYLMAFDGRIGSGRSLLVDLSEGRVVALRDFSVRAG